MRNFTIAAIAATGIALGAVQSASAADIARPVYKAAPVIMAYNWSGFYIGGNVGYGWGQGDGDIFGYSWNQDGFFGGGQIGWNWQAPGSNWVWGVEVDSQWANMKDSVTFGLGGGVSAMPTASLTTSAPPVCVSAMLGIARCSTEPVVLPGAPTRSA